MRSHLVLAAMLVFGASCKKPEPALVSPREVETPGPDAARLAETQAAREGRSGSVKVAYCIDPEGETKDVEVVESFGDPQVDALVVQTVDAWRYQPATRDGVPFEQCTDYTFELQLGT
jgi:periplasmic protein TonB